MTRESDQEPTDISPPLPAELGLDHVVAVIGSSLLGMVWVSFGPQSVFYLCAASAVVQLFVAVTLPQKENAAA